MTVKVVAMTVVVQVVLLNVARAAPMTALVGVTMDVTQGVRLNVVRAVRMIAQASVPRTVPMTALMGVCVLVLMTVRIIAQRIVLITVHTVVHVHVPTIAHITVNKLVQMTAREIANLNVRTLAGKAAMDIVMAHVAVTVIQAVLEDAHNIAEVQGRKVILVLDVLPDALICVQTHVVMLVIIPVKISDGHISKWIKL